MGYCLKTSVISVCLVCLAMASTARAECTGVKGKKARLLACEFSDLLGEWNPDSKGTFESGTMTIEEKVLRFTNSDTIPIIVVRKEHPIIIEQGGSYARLEVSVFQTSLGYDLELCFQDYKTLQEAEAEKNGQAYYCYSRPY